MKLKNPVNIILLAISFVIFGGLGLIFITQMELLPGYNWNDKQDLYPTELGLQLTGDLSGDGIPDLIANAYATDVHLRDIDRYIHVTPHYGGIFAINSLTGTLIWETEYNTPVRELMLIGDINDDGYDDFLANMMAMNDTWKVEVSSDGEVRYKPQFIHDQFTNRIISGGDLIEGGGIPLSGNITKNLVYDAIKVSNLDDNFEDLILLEGKFSPLPDYHYEMNISTYYINGTRTKTIDINTNIHAALGDHNTPAMKEFDYGGENHALFVGGSSLILFNSSLDNLLDPIFSKTVQSISTFNIIEDITLDGIPEILIADHEGNVSLFNGFDGNLMKKFMIPIIPDYRVDINPMESELDDGTAFVLLTTELDSDPKQFHGWVYTISATEENIIWEYHRSMQQNEDRPNLVVLDDITGDNIGDIMLAYRHLTLIGTEVKRIVLINPITNAELGLTNSDYYMEDIVIIPDFDGDGLNDIAFEDGSRIIGFATQDPIAIWLSPIFPIGTFLLVLLATILVFGIIILIINGRKLKPKRERLQQSKMAVVVNIVVIALMIVSFLMFLLQLNIFNRTLIIGDPMTGITEVYLAVTIIWFGLLPLTAAIYNQFAPRFAYAFVALRSMFFKFSKSYKYAIFIEDLQGRKQLSTTIRLKRVILPMLLSISVGFFSYNSFSVLLGYPQTFDTFGGQDFFGFMIGYNLLCLLPMVLTFIVFSFFISGNFLLDDAGVAYYLESKKHRRPGDIEPISIWSQSIIKGIAGFSAIITFVAFFQTVDFSGFFTESGDNAIFMFIFGIFLVTVMFYGTPFLTSFAYILFSVEVMDYSYDINSEKLYEIMRKHGYDTTPRTLANLFPNGYEPLRKSKESLKKEK